MMQAWGDWMGRVGPALADGGALTGDHARVGGSGAPLPITGYNLCRRGQPRGGQGLV